MHSWVTSHSCVGTNWVEWVNLKTNQVEDIKVGGGHIREIYENERGRCEVDIMKICYIYVWNCQTISKNIFKKNSKNSTKTLYQVISPRTSLYV